MLCCVVCSYLDIKAVCLKIVGQLPVLHYIICLFFAFRTVYYTLGYQVITDTWAVQQSLLLKRSMGLETSAGCLASSTHHPCAPCVWRFSRPGSHHLPSFSSRPSPSCGTCGSRRSPICCSVVMVEKQEGHLSPGNQWQELCPPFWGWPWKSPQSCYHLCHCWACHPRLQRTSWRWARGTPSCGYARLRKIQRPASNTSCIHSWHCNALL